jgi:hypothetical protein
LGYLFKDKCTRGIFSIPHALLDDDVLSGLSPSAWKLLLFLYRAMNRFSAPCIRISLTQLAGELELDAKTIRAARIALESKGAIRSRRAEKTGGTYEYHLVNPETREPFPPADGRPETAEYKPRKSRTSLSAPSKVDSLAVPVTGSRVIDPLRTEQKPLTSGAVVPLEGQTPSCCYTCKGTEFWYLPDDAQRCSACHPNPNGLQSPGPISRTILTSTGTDPVMTKDGLPLKF